MLPCRRRQKIFSSFGPKSPRRPAICGLVRMRRCSANRRQIGSCKNVRAGAVRGPQIEARRLISHSAKEGRNGVAVYDILKKYHSLCYCSSHAAANIFGR